MKQEYKHLLKYIFHSKDHEGHEPDYYSWKFEYLNEEDKSIGLRLDENITDMPLHDLISNLMEWGLMITKLVITGDEFDNEWLHMEITEIPTEVNK
jgi:hypothetical protein